MPLGLQLQPTDETSSVKTMLICYFDANGVMHKEFVLFRLKVNKQYYLDALRRSRESVERKRLELWSSDDWIFHHDNALAHTALNVSD